MKILQVFPIFSLRAGGGTVDVIYKLSKALIQRGHDVAIYTSDFKLDQEYADSLQGVKFYPFHSWLNLRGLHLMPDMIMEAKRRLKDYDIIHIHTYRNFQNAVLHHYANKHDVPYVIDAHGSVPRTFGKKRAKWLFDIIFGYRLLRNASRLIAETEVGVNEYRELGVDQNKIVLLSPPFDTEEFSQLPPPGQFKHKFSIKEKHIVMFLGRIHWIKGIDFLVESFHELNRHRNDAILVIVGTDDGYKYAIVDLIAKLNLSNKVLFTGFLSSEDKLSALVDADVVVQTSRYEQGAWAPIEAVLCNTPIIVSDNSGAGEDVKRIDAGYLVEFGNKNDLCNKIQYVLDNRDEALNKTKKAKEYIEANLSMTRRIVEYEELYKACIEESKNQS